MEEALPFADYVLVMSVNPGFGGQKVYIRLCSDKVRRLRKMINDRKLPVKIEIDGGISEKNIAEAVSAGAEIIVAGSAVFGKENPAQAVRELIEKGTNWI